MRVHWRRSFMRSMFEPAPASRNSVDPGIAGFQPDDKVIPTEAAPV